jgi:hypothetical protein
MPSPGAALLFLSPLMASAMAMGPERAAGTSTIFGHVRVAEADLPAATAEGTAAYLAAGKSCACKACASTSKT